MRIHTGLKGIVNKKNIFKLAKKVGLDKINYDSFYMITKLKSKKKKSHIPFVEDNFSTTGEICLIGDGKKHVAVFISDPSQWFRTSSILKCKKVKKGFKIETSNSFYLLEELK